jgi:hypothetical protein
VINGRIINPGDKPRLKIDPQYINSSLNKKILDSAIFHEHKTPI